MLWLLSRLVFGLLSLVALPAQAEPMLALSAAEQAWLAQHPVVRVGLSTEFPPYYFADGQGRYEGFVVDLMDRLAQHMGVRMEYRRFERFGEVLDALNRGDVDLTPFVAESPSRREALRFVRPLFSTQMVYVADRRVGELGPDALFGNYRIAVERLSTAAELMRERYPQAALVEHDTAEQALLAVASGSADVYVGFRQVAVYFIEKHLMANLALRGTVATPGTALGPAVRKDNLALAGILEKAIASLGGDEVALVAMKWLPRTLLGNLPRQQVSLSDAQRAWVQSHGSLRLGFDAEFAPIAFANLTRGFDGMAADITRTVAGKVGLIVALEQGGTFADVYARALRGEIDVIVGAARNAERGADFDFVGPFLRVPTVIVAASDRDFDAGLDGPGRRRLALLRQHFLKAELRSRHPNLEFLEYATQSAVLDAVRRGEAELGIGNMKVVNLLLEARHAGALRTIGTVPGGDSELYFAVRKALPELAGVLRAGLDAVPAGELAEIENRWLRVHWTEGVPWSQVLAGALAAAALASVVVGSLWLGNRRLRQAQSTLAQAHRLAEEQVAARAGFTAYLSHELRGSLGGLVGGLGLMDDPALPPTRQRQLLGAMRASSAGLLELCERTLDFERTLQGGVDLQPGPVRLGELLDAALAPWRVQAELKGVALHTELAVPPDTQVVCDAVRLGQVLQNVVGNAVKFTAHGRVDVRARLDAGPGGTGTLHVAVSDTGPGVAEADRGRLFQAFAQGAAGRQAGGGAGLGLSISARIVAAMGGTLELTRTSSEGSTFDVSVPVPWGDPQPGLPAAGVATPVIAVTD